MSIAPPPPAVRVLGDAVRIKAYVHPVRMVILQLLARERRTVTSVARELGVRPANLTHHFKLLERLGLVRLVEKRDTGRNLEKYYRAAARHFVVRPRVRSAGGRQALALSILRDDLSAAVERMRPGAGPALGLLAAARVRPADGRRFARRLKALIAEFQRADEDGGRPYRLNLSLYPGEMAASPQERIRVEIA